MKNQFCLWIWRTNFKKQIIFSQKNWLTSWNFPIWNHSTCSLSERIGVEKFGWNMCDQCVYLMQIVKKSIISDKNSLVWLTTEKLIEFNQFFSEKAINYLGLHDRFRRKTSWVKMFDQYWNHQWYLSSYTEVIRNSSDVN